MNVQKKVYGALAHGFKTCRLALVFPRPIDLLTMPTSIMFRVWNKTFSQMFSWNTLNVSYTKEMEKSSNGVEDQENVRSLLFGLHILPPHWLSTLLLHSNAIRKKHPTLCGRK